MSKLVFISTRDVKEQETPLWMKILRAILVGVCIALTFAIVTIYANETRADYSMQFYFSQTVEKWRDCVDNIVSQDVLVGTVNNTPQIESNKREMKRLQELLSRLQVETDSLMLTNGQPIYETREISSEVCTERTLFCGDGIVNMKESCDSSPNCSSSCTCNAGYLLMSTNSCQAIPMSEEKQPELMKTGASLKKTIKK